MADNEEISPASPEDDAPNKPLTDEQEEALNKILTELEGPRETGEETTSEDNDDAAAEDQTEETANGLTDEQEEALQKIMAEIEGKPTDSAASEETATNTSITAEQEETLNKIVAELQDNAPINESDKADILKEKPAAENSDETGTEELSAEQEEALQQIMAEIESKTATASDSQEPSPNKEPVQKEDSTELEENNPETPPDLEPEPNAVPEPAESKSEKPVAQKPETPKEDASDKGFEELDLSDFESELQKVVSEAKNQSTLEQKPPRKLRTAAAKEVEKSKTEETVAENSAETSSPEDSDNAKRPTPEALEESIATTDDEKSLPPESSLPERASEEDKDAREETPKTASEAKAYRTGLPPIKEVFARSYSSTKKSVGKRVLIWSSAMAAIFIIAMGIRWIPSLLDSNKGTETDMVLEESQEIVDTGETAEAPLPAPSNDLPDLSQAQRNTLTNILKNINTLRISTTDKVNEIKELQVYYQQGIQETEENLIKRIRDQKLTDLKEAITDQRMEFGLRTIQRRKGYISKLQVPFDQLIRANEELLYLERKADIFLKMIENTSGINLDPYEKQVTEALERIRSAQDHLSIDPTTPSADSIEIIWEDLLAKARSATNKKLSSTELAGQNASIWKEICSGNFSRKWALTQLDKKTAECLLQWDGKDLYLNRLTALTPEVAQIIAHWPGEWLGLNGLENLTPETARHLARWKGKRLSLNGLTELSPKATLYLSKWQGDQLELIGLKHIGQWENPKVKLFVSDKLRSQLPK